MKNCNVANRWCESLMPKGEQYVTGTNCMLYSEVGIKQCEQRRRTNKLEKAFCQDQSQKHAGMSPEECDFALYQKWLKERRKA